MRLGPIQVIALCAALIAFGIAANIYRNSRVSGDTAEATELQRLRNESLQANDMTDQYPALPGPGNTGTTVDPSAPLQPMTGDECAAAGAEAGWSSTWGPASDGCWIISPDGSQNRHLGTWKE